MPNQQVIEKLADLTYCTENTVEELNSKPNDKYCGKLIKEFCEKLSDVKEFLETHYLKD